MKNLLILILSIFIFIGCSTKNQNAQIKNFSSFKTKIEKLNLQVESLSNTIDKKEAQSFAYDAIKYSKQLAKEYKVITPALVHNTLINMNIKKRGLCYHYANDLLKYLKQKDFKSFKFIKVIANRGEYFEHTSIALTTKNIKFEDSIILDAWRDTGDLYFSKVKDDKRYKWEIK